MNMKSSRYNNILFLPDPYDKGQRALVLQGGGSLGAYEAGAYQALYERITKTDREKGDGCIFYNALYVIVRQPIILLLGIDFYLHTV